MKIEKLMTVQVRACAPTDSLGTAAHLMWEGDCGIVPVIDVDGCPVGVLTDRDIAMSALFRGDRLGEIPVADAMSRRVAVLKTDDSLHDALELMRTSQVRRLPVVDAKGRLAGVLSLSDIARQWGRRESVDQRELRADDVALTLAGICRTRQEQPKAVMVVEITPQGRPGPAQAEEPATTKPARKPRASARPRGKSKKS